MMRLRGGAGGGGEAGGAGGERRSGGTRAVHVEPGLANALLPDDWLPLRRSDHRHHSGRERDRGGALVHAAAGATLTRRVIKHSRSSF